MTEFFAMFASLSSPGDIMLFVLLCYAFFLSQIIIHACSHYALSGSVAVDTFIGSLLSVFNFHTFAGWRALHLLHHRYTNTYGQDPACPRHGEPWATYLVTALYKMFTFTRTHFYRQHTSRGAALDRVERLAPTGVFRRAVSTVAQTWEPWVALTGLIAYTSAACGRMGGAGVLLPFTTWVIPWLVGQLLMADFNFRTHEGCPPRGSRRPYDGEDTLSLRTGIWRICNILTLGFYLHREHHLDPGVCLWFFGHPHCPHKKKPRRFQETL
jgi:fatty acid desaturase